MEEMTVKQLIDALRTQDVDILDAVGGALFIVYPELKIRWKEYVEDGDTESSQMATLVGTLLYIFEERSNACITRAEQGSVSLDAATIQDLEHRPVDNTYKIEAYKELVGYIPGMERLLEFFNTQRIARQTQRANVVKTTPFFFEDKLGKQATFMKDYPAV